MVQAFDLLRLDDMLDLNKTFLRRTQSFVREGENGRPRDAVRVAGTPTVMHAFSVVVEAAKKAERMAQEAGNPDLGKEVARVLEGAIGEALSQLDKQSASVSPDQSNLYGQLMGLIGEAVER